MDTTELDARGGFRPDLVPLWAKIAAWTIPVLTLPSVAWRLTTAIDARISGDNPCIDPARTPLPEQLYVLALLPIVQVGLALLSLGLVQRWGVLLPRRLPVLGERRVPIGFGVTAATAGALGLAAVVAWQLFQGGQPLRDSPAGCHPPGPEVLALYLPMVLWPPLLLALAWHYRRRRRAERS